MKVELLKSFGKQKKGNVIEVSKSVYEMLKEKGRATATDKKLTPTDKKTGDK